VALHTGIEKENTARINVMLRPDPGTRVKLAFLQAEKRRANIEAAKSVEMNFTRTNTANMDSIVLWNAIFPIGGMDT
jgi:endo-beta-N-acetylglucosaminidase D